MGPRIHTSLRDRPDGRRSLARHALNDLGIYERLASLWWQPAGPFRALRALNGPRFAHWDGEIASYRGKRCVDLGCGGGLVAAELDRRGAHVVGLDLSPGSVAEARRSRDASTGQYVVGDARRAPLPDAFADLVVCADLLEHLDPAGRARVLRESARMLVPGGSLLYDTINRTFLARLVVVRLFERIGVVPRGTHDPALLVRPRELDRDLEGAGLRPWSRSGFMFLGVPGRAPFVLTRWEGLCYVGTAVKPAPR